MELTLAVWKPLNSDKPLRHRWKNGKKQQPVFDTHYSITDYRTHDKIDREWVAFQFTRIRSGDTGEGFGQAIPVISKKKCFKRDKHDLKDELLSTIILDFDKNYSEISLNMGNDERVKVLEAKHPFLEGLEMVAWCSSSAFVKGDLISEQRANMHIIVFLDKGYTRDTIKAFLKQMEGVDNALGTISQPLFVTPPELINTEQNEANNAGFYSRDGMKLNLGKYISEVSAGSPIPKEINDLPDDHKKLEEDLIRKIGDSPEGAGRYELFSNLAKKEAFKEKGINFDALFTVLNNPIIRGNRSELFVKERIDFGKNIVRDREIDYEIWKSNWRKRGDNSEDLDDIASKYNLSLENVETRDIKKKLEIKNDLMGNMDNSLFDVMNIHSKDLQKDLDVSEISQTGITLLKSGCGTGKTRSLHNYINHYKFKRVLYITQLKSTIESFRSHMRDNGIDFFNYEEIGSKNAKDYYDHDYLAITDQSLWKLFQDGASCKDYSLVVIDECETFFKQEGLNDPRIYRSYYSLAKNAEAVLMMDADITDEVSGRAAVGLAKERSNKAKVIKNNSDYLDGMRITRIKEKYGIYQKLWDLVAEGNDVYCHVSFNDDKKKLSAIKSAFEEQYQNLIVDIFYSDRKDKAMQKLKANSAEYIENQKKSGKQYLLIVSPWAIVGWDYWSNYHQFDKTVGIYEGNHKTAPHIHQGLRRARKTEDHFVWINPEYNYFAKNSHEDLQERAIPGYSQLELSHSEMMADLGRKRLAKEKSNIGYHFKMIVEERGAIYKEISYPPNDGCKEVFDSFEMDEIDKEINLIMHNEEEYLRFVRKFAVPRPSCDCIDLIDGHCEIHPVTWDKENIKNLWERNQKIRQEDIEKLLRIWRLDSKDRRNIDGHANHWVACNKGELLDEIDRLISLYELNEYSSFAEFAKDGSQELVIMVDTEQGERLKALLKHISSQLAEDSYFFRKRDGNNHWSWLKRFFEKLDFDVESHKGRGKKEIKLEIRKKYKNLGLLKGASLVKEQISIIDQNIAKKVNNKERLLPVEWEWLHEGKKRFVINYKENPRVDLSKLYGRSYGQINDSRNFMEKSR